MGNKIIDIDVTLEGQDLLKFIEALGVYGIKLSTLQLDGAGAGWPSLLIEGPINKLREFINEVYAPGDGEDFEFLFD